MSVFRFSIELLIPIAATNLLPFTPFFGLEAQQIHSPLQKRLGTSTEMFPAVVSGLATQVGTRRSAIKAYKKGEDLTSG